MGAPAEKAETPGPRATTGLVVEVLPVGPLQCNCVILADPATREALVVDPGGDADEVLARLKDRGLSVREILHTHAHVDHVCGTAGVRRATGGRVGLHRGDLPLYENLRRQAEWIGFEPPEAAVVDRWLEEGDRIAFGDRAATVLHTPGHTPGSLSFLVEGPEGPLLLAGDTLFLGSVGRTDLWGGDTDTLVRSIRGKLYGLPEETRVIPGHGGETTIGRERRQNAFVRG